MLGITFGGLSVGNNGEIRKRRIFKIFGYIYAFLVTIWTMVGMIFTLKIKEILDIYEGGFPIRVGYKFQTIKIQTLKFQTFNFQTIHISDKTSSRQLISRHN